MRNSSQFLHVSVASDFGLCHPLGLVLHFHLQSMDFPQRVKASRYFEGRGTSVDYNTSFHWFATWQHLCFI